VCVRRRSVKPAHAHAYSYTRRQSFHLELQTSGNPNQFIPFRSHKPDQYPPSTYGFTYDAAFVRTAEQNNLHQIDTLESNLRTSRSSLAKEAILKAGLNLAKHFITTGRTSDALYQLFNAKSYAAGPWQMQEMILLMAETGLNNHSFSKVRELYDPNMETKASNMFLSKLNAARGVAYLAEGQIKEAAKSFLSTTNELTNEFNQVVSAQDIALYGGLTALLALDRTEIAAMVEKNGGFRDRLEFVPVLRDAMHCYVRAEYGECLGLIDSLRGGWAKDVYLAPQADSLWRRVRGKCLVQYFEPYASVSLTSMMDSFAFENVDEAEDVVADLLERKEIAGARIDGVNKTLSGSSVDDLERRRRRVMMRKLGRMGDGLLDEVEGMILRMACVENGVVVGKGGGTSKRNRRDWGPAMSKSAWGLESSGEEDGGEGAMEAEDSADLMETDDLNLI